MLGYYENFPEIIHGFARFSFTISPKEIQQSIALTLHKLNNEKIKLKDIGFSFPAACEVGFEFGVGENVDFTFLNKTELSKLEKTIKRSELVCLDFLCSLKYHLADFQGKHSALRFDYFLIRFIFRVNDADLLIYHERGPRRVHVEDLITFLNKRIKQELINKHSTFLKLETV